MSVLDGNGNGGNGFYMPVAPAYGGGSGGGNGFGWGADGGLFWLLVLFLFGFAGNWGGGFGGGNGATPMMWNTTQNDVQRGFDQQSIMNGINGINGAVTTGFGNVQTALCNGFGNVQTSLCNGFAGVNQNMANGFAQAEIAENGRQMANMNQAFAAQTAMAQGFNGIQSQLAQCCCDNRLATAQLQSVVQTENCADRQAVNDGIRDLLTNQNANTQRILDQLCQDKIDAKNDEIANLRTQLNMATLRESQTAQNAFIANGLTQEVDALYNRLNNCPVPTTPVYGRTPIFTCNNNSGCGCGCGNNGLI